MVTGKEAGVLVTKKLGVVGELEAGVGDGLNETGAGLNEVSPREEVLIPVNGFKDLVTCGCRVPSVDLYAVKVVGVGVFLNGAKVDPRFLPLALLLYLMLE